MMENPLINTYKVGFITRRIVQTLLGGPRLILGFSAPFYIYLLQIVLFSLPVIIGGTSIALIQIAHIDIQYGMLFCGSMMCMIILFLQLIANLHLNKHVAVTKINRSSLLAEDDELEFTSCTSMETLEFLFPQKRGKLKCILCALISGLLGSLSVGFLLPSRLREQHSDLKVNTVLFTFGWLTVCVAQYSLTATSPPEPAPFSTVDHWISMLSRPFYALLLLGTYYILWCANVLYSVGICLHIIFCMLPLLWLLGILPPLDALLLWFGEQILVYGFGGSPVASNSWFVVMLFISCCEVVLLMFLQEWPLVAMSSAALGYLLSIDLRSILNQLCHDIQSCCTSRYNKESKIAENFGALPLSSKKFRVVEIGLHIGLIIMCASLTFVQDFVRTANEPLQFGHLYFGLVFGVCYIVLSAVRLLHGVYLFGGLFRNYWYPTSALINPSKLKEQKKKLTALHILSNIIFKFLIPFAMVIDLSCFGDMKLDNFSMTLLSSVAAARAFRHIWQHTEQALLDLIVAHFLYSTTLLLPVSFSFLFSLLVIGFVLRRMHQLFQKLYVVTILLVTAMSLNLHRPYPLMWTLLVIDILLLPLILIIVFLTTLVSAPLLPLFTLPCFLGSFPRPVKFWPGRVGKTANTCPDTVYYEQLVYRLVKSIASPIARGSLGYLDAGDYLLARYQDRLIWIQFLERGYNYYTVNIKGLELQETSCHSVEASHVDAIFEHAFNPLEEKGHRVSLCNPYFMDCLTPCDIIPIRTYSDARNMLTGLIDSPDTLHLIMQYFPQVLLWVLLYNAVKRFQEGLSVIPTSEKDSSDDGGSVKSAGSRPPSRQSQLFVEKVNQLKPEPRRLSDHSVTEVTSLKEERQDSSPKEKKQQEKWARVVRSGSFGSMSWSEDEDQIETSSAFRKYLKGDEQERKKRPSLLQRLSQSSSSVTSMPGQPDNSFLKLKDMNVITKESSIKSAWTSDMSLIERTSQFKTNYTFSESSRLGPRKEWISSSNLYLHSKDSGAITEQWFHFVLKHVLDTHETLRKIIGDRVLSDRGLYEAYKHLIIECHQYLNTEESSIKNIDPAHVYRLFLGNFADSAVHEWIKKDKELSELLLKAYRYTVKLALDQSLLGYISTDEELKDYLQDYTDNWHIGKDSDEAWTKAVLTEKEFIFSMGYNEVQGTYSSHLLTLQEIPVYIGSLNSAVVNSIWSTLALELLYLTNDDEERYSIQAHPTILRNLTVQAADIPLGYPIYNSPPMSISVLY